MYSIKQPMASAMLAGELRIRLRSEHAAAASTLYVKADRHLCGSTAKRCRLHSAEQRLDSLHVSPLPARHVQRCTLSALRALYEHVARGATVLDGFGSAAHGMGRM
jgi:hypothetical protein